MTTALWDQRPDMTVTSPNSSSIYKDTRETEVVSVLIASGRDDRKIIQEPKVF